MRTAGLDGGKSTGGFAGSAGSAGNAGDAGDAGDTTYSDPSASMEVAPLDATAAAADGELAELGRALGRRSAEVAAAIVEHWERRNGFGGTPQELDQRAMIRETTHLGTNAVALYLITHQSPTEEQAGAMSRSGRAPVEERLSLSGLTRLYLLWRDMTTEAVREEASRLGSSSAVTEEAVQVVRAGSDSALVGMAKQFDAAYGQLRSQLAVEQEQLDHLAHYDALTGLANRALLLDELSTALDPDGSPARSVLGVLFMDVDRFKAVNDRAGHQVGDAFLSVLAGRLRHAIRAGDTPGRFGGDEFVVLCRNLIGGEAEASAVAARIVSSLSVPVVVGGIRFDASASIGITVAIPGDDPEDVLSRADGAMYRAKRRGRGRYELALRPVSP